MRKQIPAPCRAHEALIEKPRPSPMSYRTFTIRKGLSFRLSGFMK